MTGLSTTHDIIKGVWHPSFCEIRPKVDRKICVGPRKSVRKSAWDETSRNYREEMRYENPQTRMVSAYENEEEAIVLEHHEGKVPRLISKH